ncbi:hypothetical protein XANCAGTX0491_002544 [Xanthoria calcicola]
MASRKTRGSAAKEAAFIASSQKENTPHHLLTPSATSLPSKQNSPAIKFPTADKEMEFKAKSAATPTTTKGSTRTKPTNKPGTPATSKPKRKRDVVPKIEEAADELPHGLGRPWKASENGMEAPESSVAGSPRKEDDENPSVKDEKATTPSTKLARTSNDVEEPPAKKSRKKKANPYGLTPGTSPFPEWPHPTPEECQQVNDLLSTIHGTVKAPDKIPEPSSTVAGCGEVPSVLDALIRTLLSAATSGRNSSRAFQGLIEEYGRKKTGIGKGSVDWDAVRRSDVSRVFTAIKSGGLADVKSKKIKLILDMVHEENQARRDALILASREADAQKGTAMVPKGANCESEEAKKIEIQGADEDVLSLDYLHSMPSQESFNHMLKYPGIGVKTASCVTMFCLRRPSFAVDTHVFRLCQWLGWVPEKANRDTTFMHCEVMVPDELKYPLHQLLIQHGKKCGRCRAITGESSEGWGKGCVIDHLVKRTGIRKGGTSPAKAKRSNKAKKGEETDEHDEDEDQDTDTNGEEDSNTEISVKNREKLTKAKRTTPRRISTRSKIEQDHEELEMENEREQESSEAESVFEPPNRKKAKTVTPKKRGQVRKSK